MRHYTKYQLSKLNNHVPRMRKCVVCKHLFDTQSYVFKPTAIYPIIRKTCSKSCTAKNMGYKNRRFNKTCRCIHCNKTFLRKKKPHQKFCNRKCYHLFQKGKPRPQIQKWIHKIQPPKNSISISGIRWLNKFDLTHREHYLTIGKKRIRVDGFNETTESCSYLS